MCQSPPDSHCARRSQSESGAAVAAGAAYSFARVDTKFRSAVFFAYIILMLTNTLNDMSVKPESIKAYKAIVIIIIVIAGSPAVKDKISAFWRKIRFGSRKAMAGR